MSPAAQRARNRTSGTRSKKKSGVPRWLVILWPLLLGILVTPFAVRGASVLAMNGPAALRLLYPYVILVHSHAQQWAGNQDETLSQWVLYGQFPFYGALWILGRRLVRGSGGPLSVAIVHCVGVALVLFLPNN